MNRRTNRNRTNRQCVTWFDRRVFATDDRRASANTLRCQNVTALTVGVLDQRDVCTAIRIILKALNNTGNAVLVALEVNNAVMLLVATALMTNRYATVVVATTIA